MPLGYYADGTLLKILKSIVGSLSSCNMIGTPFVLCGMYSLNLQRGYCTQKTLINIEQISRLLRGFVALEALDILEGELQRSNRHQLDSSNCGCKLRHSCGLPYACMLSVYLNSVMYSGGSLTYHRQLLWKMRIFVVTPSKTLIKEPTIQKNTHGRPTLKKQQQKRVDSISQAPRRRSHSTTSKSVGLDLVELNKEPAKHSSYVIEIPDLNPEPSEQVSDFIDLSQMPKSCDTHPLMKEILDMFHPYITHVQDIKGDGNCGFEAISVCLGYGEDQWLYVRHQLLDELLSSYDVYARVFIDGIDELRNSLCFSQSPAPAEHWMVMLMTSVLIANKFGVVLNYLTKRGDITFFALWREGDYPMSTISACWISHRAPSTAGWQTMYMSRLEFYRQLKPYNLKTPVITIENYC
ncbi:hypothetical protein GOBAR_DD14228 [Gossypium barbadense]|nr:hypothetical protein GOBAR_DD14228 [Gossypium barbadense]